MSTTAGSILTTGKISTEKPTKILSKLNTCMPLATFRAIVNVLQLVISFLGIFGELKTLLAQE